MYYLLVGIYVLTSLLLMIVILLQQGKGGDIAAAFGGGGGTGAAFGARAGATLLTKVTTGLAAVFIVLSLVLTIYGLQGPSSVVGGVDEPAPIEQAAPPAATPPPAEPPPQ